MNLRFGLRFKASNREFLGKNSPINCSGAAPMNETNISGAAERMRRHRKRLDQARYTHSPFWSGSSVRKQLLYSFITNGVAGNEKTTISIVHQVGALWPRPPTIERTLSAMAHDDKVRADLLGELSDLFGRLASHQFCHGVKAQLFQPRDAFLQDLLEVFLHLSGGYSHRNLGQQQRSSLGEDR